MENITKALLMAGGILFVILVLTLVVIFFNQMTTYYTEEHNAKMLEQLVEFNNKFDNYSGQTIRGNELISVMNKIVDYNHSYSDMDGYERITINIDLRDHQSELQYPNVSSSNILFPQSVITNRNGNDDNIRRISGLSIELENNTGIEETKLQKLSADISIIFSTDESDKQIRNSKLQKILGYNKDKTFTAAEIADIQDATVQYYQLTQFKRAMFKCTEVIHSQTGGSINQISFEAVIENGQIKLN